MNSCHEHRVILPIVLVMLLVPLAAAAADPSPPAVQPSSSLPAVAPPESVPVAGSGTDSGAVEQEKKPPLAVAYRDGRLSVKAEGADIRDVFKEVGTKAGIEVEIHPAVKGAITSDFADRNLQVAIVDLARGFSYGFIYDKAGEKWILRKVTIIPSGKPEVSPTPPEVAARVRELIERLKSEDYDVLKELWSLTPQALPVIRDILMTIDPRERMSTILTHGLLGLKDERAMPYLREYLQKYDEEIRSGSHPEHYPVSVLEKQRAGLDMEIHNVEAMIFINTIIPKEMPPGQRIPILASLLEHENGHGNLSHVASIELEELYRKESDPRQVLDVFIQRLKASEAKDRSLFAHKLGRFGDPYALPALKEALGDSNKGVREVVKEAIDKILSKNPELRQEGGNRP